MNVQKSKEKSLPLSRLVTIPPKPYASTSIEQDSITTLQNYLPSASTLEIIERFSAGLRGTKSGRMLSITGPYGSGKSTMTIFLNGLLSGTKNSEWKAAYDTLKTASISTANILVSARKKSNTHEKGVIRCAVTARREPISVTILRGLDDGARKYFKNYTNRHFTEAKNLHQKIHDLKKNKIPSAKEITDIITSMCKAVPVVIMIDEFGKNIEYFTADDTQQSDLFLLQELAELSGPSRKIRLSIITLQHMAFEEYAVGASTAQKQEWAKIQGRFEDIPFANSPDQTRLLVSNTIQLDKSNKHRRIVKTWANAESKHMKRLGIESGFDADLIASCYPLGPLALEILPELCSRYGQYERTLLSFISDAGKYTVATFIDENTWTNKRLPVIGIDVLYDYFISGTSMIHSSSVNITRLMEIEMIIRDSHGLSDLEIKTLKIIGVLNLIGRSGYLRASQNLIEYAIGDDSKQVLKKLEKKSIITYRRYADEYRIWQGTDIDIASKLSICRKRYQKSSLAEMLHNMMNLEPIVAAKHSIETGTMRIFERKFIAQSPIILDESYDGVIIYLTDNAAKFECDKPVITVSSKNTVDLRSAVIDVIAIRTILDDDKEIESDWVARKELEERLSDAEIILDREFDNASKLSICRKRYQKSSLAEMLHNMMNLEPIVAAKHSIETGTMRIFERKFIAQSPIILDESYDGVIIYLTDNAAKFECDKPVITVSSKNTVDLRSAVIDVIAIRTILDDDKEIESDWVARKELEERLSDAEIILDREFDNAYGNDAVWEHLRDDKTIKCKGTPSEIASQICDSVYNKTPIIYNEMINKTLLSSQGSAAKRNLIDYMITRTDKQRLGIEGYGPDRAVYEAIFTKNNLHAVDSELKLKLCSPSKTNSLYPVWDAMLDSLKRSKKRVSLSILHHLCKMPPFGMKEGVITILVIAILLKYKNNIALYEHGTYIPFLLPEIGERMIKNPNHFELKYFKSTSSKKAFLSEVIKRFEINSEGSVLDVVSHLVRIVSALPPYVKQTKRLDDNSLAVRDAVLVATEPDTLLFESLPKALGFNASSKSTQKDAEKFAKILTKSKTILQKEFQKMTEDIKKLLLDSTGIENREKLSKIASKMLQSVTDHKMKMFLTAVTSDALERDEDWINYVALSLTDVPPLSWKDDQREMFENNLIEISKKFQRLASVHFADISDNFVKPSYQITVTNSDGSEHHNVVSLKPKQKKKIESIAQKILQDMKKKGFTNQDLSALIAILSSRSQ